MPKGSILQGDFAFPDGFGGGKTVHGNSLLKPWLTLKNGVEIVPKPEFQ
jgi:hypothetical protein